MSAEFLEALAGRHEVAAAVTQPEKPSGRGRKVHSTPVAECAGKLGIPVFTPGDLKDTGFAGKVRDTGALTGIVVAYGRILPREVFDIPEHGCFNVHFSLLPAYRGAAPIQWALIKGEERTGVTVFRIDEGLDTGAVYAVREVKISEDDDARTLRERMVRPGIEAMFEAMKKAETGAEPRAQEGEAGTAPPLNKEDGRIDWSMPAADIRNLIRGTVPWPGAYTRMGGKILKITGAAVPEGAGGKSRRPGTIESVVKNEGFLVSCGSGRLLVRKVKMEGRKELPACVFLQGARIAEGDSFE